MTTNAKKSRRANDDDRDSYSISNAILEESMKLCSELRSYVYFAFSLKSIRLVVFDTFPRAMHSIWSSFHVIVGALICTSAAISLAFAFDVSAMFFTMPLCFLAVGGRLMTPTEIDDERLRRKAAEAYYKAKATFERGRRRRNKMMKKKRRIVNANNNKEDETESSSDDEHVLGKEEYETERERAWNAKRERRGERCARSKRRRTTRSFDLCRNADCGRTGRCLFGPARENRVRGA